MPEDSLTLAKEKRLELLESLANVDDEIADYYLNEVTPSPEIIEVRNRKRYF